MHDTLGLYLLMPGTEALGPYRRFAIWTQGCPRQCPGCMSPESRNPEDGVLIKINDLIQQITATPEIEGLTISGGEPFLQAGALGELIRQVRRNRDLGVIIYTGFQLEELQSKAGKGEGEIGELLGLCDLLIDGPYIEKLNDGLSLRGSSNQRIHALTGRYASLISQYYGVPNRKVELHLNQNDLVLVGIPGQSALTAWRAKNQKWEVKNEW